LREEPPPRWANDFAGLRYLDRGRDPRVGLDCWGLVRAVYRARRGVELPDLGPDYVSAEDPAAAAAVVAALRPSWLAIDAADVLPLDVVLLRLLGRESHVGTVVSAGFFLHILPRTGSGLERWAAPVWNRRVAGFFRLPEASCSSSPPKRRSLDTDPASSSSVGPSGRAIE
jgi:cell wall-associated NlpC family hydrolase